MLPIIPIALPTPWPGLGAAFAYLIPQEPITLIDAGLGTPEAKEALLGALAAVGVRLDQIKRVLATHSHVDHIGLAGWIQQEAGAELWIHPFETGKLRRTEWWAAGQRRFLQESGVDESVVHTFFPAQIKRLDRAITPFKEWRFLREGESIPFEAGELTVLHTPGHSLGHLSFLEEATGRLIGGDILLEGQTPNPLMETLPTQAELDPGAPEWQRLRPVPYAPYRAQTVVQFWATLDRLTTSGIREVFPGHGNRFTDLTKVINVYRGRRERKLERLRNRMTEPLTALALMQVIFPHLGNNDLHLGLSDIVGHLDMLYMDGVVSVESGPAGLLYRVK
ncbi:MAG TPA: MBL fold metallo-hydrolase [Symbiobacteriaceae bacterium]|nr:MBL fold metallo-hydrolase [Symbiobacteriaceae bacterium]